MPVEVLWLLRCERSDWGGGEPERDFVDVGGEADEDEAPDPTLLARAPRCLLNMLTIGSLSPWRDSSMPSKIAAASIN